MPRIGIIGNAHGPYTVEHLEKGIEALISEFKKRGYREEIVLVSGGAAWFDHIAVMAYLCEDSRLDLELHLPCSFEARFKDNGLRDWRSNPGFLSNRYHDTFSRETGIESLKDISQSIQRGCTVYIHNGFHERNEKLVQDLDLLIAFGAGTDAPESGGTRYTWDKARCDKLFVSMVETRR